MVYVQYVARTICGRWHGHGGYSKQQSVQLQKCWGGLPTCSMLHAPSTESLYYLGATTPELAKFEICHFVKAS